MYTITLGRKDFFHYKINSIFVSLHSSCLGCTWHRTQPVLNCDSGSFLKTSSASWHLNKQESLKPSPSVRKSPSSSLIPIATLESCDIIRSALSCSKNLPSVVLAEDEVAGTLSVHISWITSYLLPKIEKSHWSFLKNRKCYSIQQIANAKSHT